MVSTNLQTSAATWPPPTLAPAGPFAAPLAEISWVMIAMGVAVTFIVVIALGLALSGRARWLGGKHAVLIGGFAFPVVVLSAALVYGLWTTARVQAPPEAGEMRIRVSGEMWWWRVTYFDGDRASFETANEIRIPIGRPVTIELESADVIHSFWVPQLAAKLDMIPGRRNILRLQADAPGIYRGQCTEFCGAAHALMAFEVIAMDEAGFAAWRVKEAASIPPIDAVARGAALFDAVGCAACHAVRGTDANGRVGPDLTHFAERRTLGAGILPNDAPTLRGWIRNADAMKPGARMPSYERLAPADLEAIALYLESLQ